MNPSLSKSLSLKVQEKRKKLGGRSAPPPWVLKGLKYAGFNRVNNDCMMIDNLLELSKAASSIRFQIRETPTSELILGTLTIDDHEAVDKSDDVDDDDE